MEDLDVLVRLASLGTSGVCIFGIFWVGFQLRSASATINELYYLALTKYMNMVIIVASISLISGALNSYIKKSELVALQNQNRAISEELIQLEENKRNAKATLELILQSKEAYQLRNPNDELKTHIEQLESYLEIQ